MNPFYMAVLVSVVLVGLLVWQIADGYGQMHYCGYIDWEDMGNTSWLGNITDWGNITK